MRRNIELFATLSIAISLMFGGRAILMTLTRYADVASLMLFAIACVAGLRLVRAIRERDDASRLAASRDMTAMLAALFAVVAVAAHPSWSIGATIAAAEFALVLEIMRLITTVEAPQLIDALSPPPAPD
jgi:hypothetical protein